MQPTDQSRLLPHLTPFRAEPGDVLAQPGHGRQPVVFPCDGAVASLGILLPDGGLADAALLGSETLLFSPGGTSAFARAVVRLPGLFLRLDGEELHAAAEASPGLRELLARAADCLLADLTRTVACNSRHDVPSRLCRWLLAVRDRQADGCIRLTQDYLARLVGARRTTVSAAAAALADAGVIRYARGLIDAPDRGALEAAACPCHAAIRAHYDRVLPGAWPPRGNG